MGVVPVMVVVPVMMEMVARFVNVVFFDCERIVELFAVSQKIFTNLVLPTRKKENDFLLRSFKTSIRLHMSICLFESFSFCLKSEGSNVK